MKLKYFISLVLLTSLASIIYGFYVKEVQTAFAHKCIGSGTVGIFLVAMPLFLIKESKGKKVKDYMLTEENILKMQGKKPKKTDSQ
ncbi:hypothetical protein [Cellulophaga sp. L1A9]|uniref:hypothetical protein n=1 Tax=Cellulophaga sp. L1A9 TaxID=2686362 RepID=UPI00131D5A98|nr:hypothetical protein [Cellulophaga sp. L1A9]